LTISFDVFEAVPFDGGDAFVIVEEYGRSREGVSPSTIFPNLDFEKYLSSFGTGRIQSLSLRKMTVGYMKHARISLVRL